MRDISLFVLVLAMLVAPLAKADVIQFTDNYGTALETVPAYYFSGCSGTTCTAEEGYPFAALTNTIPATAYIGDASGNVSDKLVTSVGWGTGCSQLGQPISCVGLITSVQFAFTTGLDLNGTPFTCASVGGCVFTYNNSFQDLGSITWGPALFPPTPGYSTDVQFQSLTGTAQTATLLNFQGGSSGNAVLLPSGDPVGEVTGSIGGLGSQDYYTFYWRGGFFSATASISNPPSGGSYLFSEGGGIGGCSGGGSATLNGADSFTGTIAINDLAPGDYCIGIDANNSNDPGFALTFNTPVSGVPEPSGAVLLSLCVGISGLLRFTKRGRKNS